jgi:tetratricopeptide (TPR) repeat protein
MEDKNVKEKISEKKLLEIKQKKGLLTYALVFITCAFIVLFVTAYSQFKFTGSISDYQYKLSESGKEKTNIQYNLNTLLLENKKLKTELNSLNKDISNVNSTIVQKKNELFDIEKKYKLALETYEALIKAENEYRNNNFLNCASLLCDKNYDFSLLNINASQRYTFLVNMTFKNSALEAYKIGYNNYFNKKYEDAISKLNLSLTLEPDGYYSDDCYYFIAYSQFRMGDKDLAKKTLNLILEKYPNTDYKQGVLDLLNKI